MTSVSAVPLSPPRAIIFDWDNTLIDSWECIRLATNATLRHMGHREWSMDETRRNVAKSMRDSFPQMFGDRWEEARDFFYATYRSIHLDHLDPLPGVTALLDQLATTGIRLAVVSNKNGSFLRKEADRLGWSRYFHRLVGATDAAEDKPSAAPVHMALDGSGIEPGEQVWFVGDAAIDMHCAINAGCVPILVRDHPPRDGEFDAHPPRRTLAGCDDLGCLVRELLIPIWPE
jgi:phosphoglycolate phosphatase